MAPVEFRDRSAEFLPATADAQSSLPHPHHLSIHAFMCEVLRMSGAEMFFDVILRRYSEDNQNFALYGGRDIPVRCWPEFEKLVQIETLRQELGTLTVHQAQYLN